MHRIDKSKCSPRKIDQLLIQTMSSALNLQVKERWTDRQRQERVLFFPLQVKTKSQQRHTRIKNKK